MVGVRATRRSLESRMDIGFADLFYRLFPKLFPNIRRAAALFVSKYCAATRRSLETRMDIEFSMAAFLFVPLFVPPNSVRCPLFLGSSRAKAATHTMAPGRVTGHQLGYQVGQLPPPPVTK